MGKNKKRQQKNIAINGTDPYSNPLCYLMAIGPFWMGLFREYQSLWASVVVLGILLVVSIRNRELRLYWNVGSVIGCAMLALSILSVFTGMLHGEAVYGLLRIVCMALWVLLLMQLPQEQKDMAFDVIPNVAVIMTLVSALMYTMGSAADIVFNNSRMGGFFQYANTFALYLLIALIIVTVKIRPEIDEKKNKNWMDLLKGYGYPVVLLIGILWSGSRTTFILTGIAMLLFIISQKKARLFYGGMVVLGVVAVVAYVLLTGNMSGIGRFMTTSLHSSTFLGRILYWKDSLQMLLKNPMGLGYMGYYYLQGKTQTGVYETQYIHNEWLQMALDFGVLFAIGFIILFIYQLTKVKGYRRWILIFFGLHMMMDFDLQYMVMAWILLLCMKWDEGNIKALEFDKVAAIKPCMIAFFVVFVGLAGWLGIANKCYQSGAYEASVSIYPWSLRAQERFLVAADTAEEYEERALRILELYPDNAPALDVMALCAAERGEYLDVLEYKKHSLMVQKYRTEVYDDFVMMMDDGAELYKKQKDEKSYQVCVDALLSTQDMLTEVKETTSSLAYEINDKPNFELSEKSKKIIEGYR